MAFGLDVPHVVRKPIQQKVRACPKCTPHATFENLIESLRCVSALPCAESFVRHCPIILRNASPNFRAPSANLGSMMPKSAPPKPRVCGAMRGPRSRIVIYGRVDICWLVCHERRPSDARMIWQRLVSLVQKSPSWASGSVNGSPTSPN